MATEIKLSPVSLSVLELLRGGETLTAKEMKTRGIENLNSSHLTQLKTNDLVVSEPVVRECATCGNREKANAYTITEKGLVL